MAYCYSSATNITKDGRNRKNLLKCDYASHVLLVMEIFAGSQGKCFITWSTENIYRYIPYIRGVEKLVSLDYNLKHPCNVLKLLLKSSSSLS